MKLKNGDIVQFFSQDEISSAINNNFDKNIKNIKDVKESEIENNAEILDNNNFDNVSEFTEINNDKLDINNKLTTILKSFDQESISSIKNNIDLEALFSTLQESENNSNDDTDVSDEKGDVEANDSLYLQKIFDTSKLNEKNNAQGLNDIDIIDNLINAKLVNLSGSIISPDITL